MTYLLQFDRAVFIWINADWTNALFDLIMPWITHLGDPKIVGVWIVGIGLLRVKQFAYPAETDLSSRQKFKLYLQVGLFFCLFLVLIYGVSAGVCNSLKYLFDRPRPFEQQHVMLRVSAGIASGLSENGSFPSGHTSNAFMVAAFLAECIPGRRYVFYGMAIIVALSRIYLGVHFPGDVLFGAFLGWSIARSMLSFQWLRNRITREKDFYSKI
jgi:undecaprenyl-diphosphatase